MLRRFCLALALSIVAMPATAAIDIGGRVTDAAGNPMRGAKIALLPIRDGAQSARAHSEGVQAEATAGAISDPAGRWALQAPQPGLWKVRVRANGFVDQEYLLQPLIDTVELPAVAMIDDAGLVVTVHQADAPVEGALVRVDAPRSRFQLGGWRVPTARGRTGSDGSLRLPAPADTRLRVAAASAGAFVSRDAVRGGRVGLTLAPGTTSSLRVVDDAGRPVADVAVLSRDPSLELARTDSAGLALLRPSAGMTLAVALAAADGRENSTEVAPPGDAAPGGAPAKPQSVVLPKLQLVAGRVIDARAREAIDAAVVWDRDDPTTAVPVDSSGAFAIRGVDGRRMNLVAAAPGYLPSSSFPHQLGDDGRPGPAIPLQAAAAIDGVVVDPEGQPVADAEIELGRRQTPGMMRIEIGGNNRMPRSRSDERGRFTLNSIEPAGSFELRIQAEGFAKQTQPLDPLQPHERREDVKVTLDRGRMLRGRVVDESGAGIPEAEVSVQAAAEASGLGAMRLGRAGASDFPGANADRDGNFAIRGLPEGRYDLTVTRSGFARSQREGLEIGPEGFDAGDVTLRPGQRLVGQVLNADGLPVEATEIFVQRSGSPMQMFLGGERPDEARPAAISDPQGWFTIEDLAEGQKVDLSLQRSGYVNKSAKALEVPQLEPVTIRLEAASIVRGLVQDEQGDPIPGAQVTLERLRTMEMGNAVMQMMMAENSAADDAGRFRFEGQEPGKITLGASAAGFQQAKRADLEIPTGKDLNDVKLSLPEGAVLEGRVLAPDGKPAVRANVGPVTGRRAMASIDNTSRQSDGNGYFRVEGLKPGPVSIQATHDDYPRTVKDLELKPGINRLNLRFEGGQAVSGRVVDDDGDGVGAALIRLAPAAQPWRGPETLSEADGSFELPGVKAGDYRLQANAEGFAPFGGADVSVADAPVLGLEARLSVGAAIFGEVRGVDDNDLPRVDVQVSGSELYAFKGSRVGTSGRYRIENLPPGDYQIAAMHADTGRRVRENVRLEPGQESLQVDLQFGGGVTLTGVVTEGGEPVIGANVSVSANDRDHRAWTTTDRSGRFRLEGLPEDRYRVRVVEWNVGLDHVEEIDVASSRDVEIEVPTAELSGRIVDAADRSPLPGVFVTLDPEGENPRFTSQHSATTDSDGRFTLRNVADGEWRLSADKEGYAALSQATQVQFERTVRSLDLEMEATEGLRLQVRGPAGGIPDSVRLAVVDASGVDVVRGDYATGEGGSVRLTRVPQGEWELVLGSSGSATAALRVNAPGPTLPVQLQPASRLEVSVPDLVGSATLADLRARNSAGRTLRLLDWNGRPQQRWTLRNGSTRLEGLEAGRWELTVTSRDGRTWSGNVEVAPGATAQARLE